MWSPQRAPRVPDRPSAIRLGLRLRARKTTPFRRALLASRRAEPGAGDAAGLGEPSEIRLRIGGGHAIDGQPRPFDRRLVGAHLEALSCPNGPKLPVVSNPELPIRGTDLP